MNYHHLDCSSYSNSFKRAYFRSLLQMGLQMSTAVKRRRQKRLLIPLEVLNPLNFQLPPHAQIVYITSVKLLCF